MGMMKQKYTEIMELLETTNLTAEQIAKTLDVDLDIVYEFMADIATDPSDPFKLAC